MKGIHELVSSPVVGIKVFRQFVSLVFERERQRYNLPPHSTIKVRPLFWNLNGLVHTTEKNGKKKVSVIINHRGFWRGRRQHSSSIMWLYVYATIVHEMEHIRLAQELEQGTITEFKDFIAALYQYNHFNRIENGKILGLIPIRNYKKTIEQGISLPELLCTLAGLQYAYETIGNYLTKSEKDTIEKMIQSLNFLADHMEIMYGKTFQPYNQFAQIMEATLKRVQKNHLLPTKIVQLSRLFGSSGELISPIKLYESRSDENKEFYDDLFINLFLTYDLDWETAFSTRRDFFQYIEGLSNRYCKRVINYLKEMSIGEVFVNKDVLRDNASMLIKNSQRLSVLMRHFGMKHTEGSVIALYR